jgi:hypothetical protein
VNNHHSKAGGATEDPAHEADRLQHDIEAIRGNLGGLIGELDHRRHEVLDLRLQLRRHAIPVAIGAAALLGLIGGGIALHVVRKRRREALPSRLRRLRQAVARMIDAPDRVAKGDPHMALKIATSAGTAGASIVGRRLAERLVKR